MTKRRTLSRYADDKAVADFDRVARENGLPPVKSAFDAALEDAGAEDQAAWDKVVRDLKP